jgi:hypothetical protein
LNVISVSTDDGVLELENVQAARDFVGQEIRFWKWLGEAGPEGQSAWHTMDGLYDQLRTSIEQGSGRLVAKDIFVTRRIPVSTSGFSQLVASIRETDQSTAAALVAFAIGAISPNFKVLSHRKAFGLLLGWDQKLTPESVEKERERLLSLLSEARKLELGLRGRIAQLEALLEKHVADAKRAKEVAARFVAHKLRLQRRSDSDRADEAIQELSQTKALYMEHMALKAPVAYWNTKAASHREKSRKYRTLLLLFSGVASVVLILALFKLSEYAVSIAKLNGPVAVYLILATIGIVMSTIVFWAARILTRLYLSEMHLGMDAEERATMVETYLALTSVNQAAPEDRTIVLASLFRPTADGIVKDDAAPDLSPAAFVSKVLGSK